MIYYWLYQPITCYSWKHMNLSHSNSIKLFQDVHEKKEEPTSEFGSWASDSRSQTNFVKTSETLNLKKHSQHQANVLSTAIFSEGEALGISPELCQDIAVLLSGPRLKTLSWDMDRCVMFTVIWTCVLCLEFSHFILIIAACPVSGIWE